MRITWFGTASLLVETGDATLAFDPFDGIPLSEKRPGNGILPHVEEFRRAEHVFLTHGHFDHIMHIPSIYKDTGCMIYGTETPIHTLMKHGVPQTQTEKVIPGDCVVLGNTKVRVFKSKHCRFDFPLIMRTVFSKRSLRRFGRLLRLLYLNSVYPEKRETLCYVVGSEEKNVMILGSLGLDPEVEYPQGADLLILPYQGKNDPEKAALAIVERIMPKMIVLDHFDDSFPPMTSEIPTENFIKIVEERYGIPCRILKKSEPLFIV